MKISLTSWKRMYLITAALLAMVAILIALFVVPQAAVDTHPGVKHEEIAFIWGVNISMNVLILFLLTLISIFSKVKGGVTAPVVIFLMFILFILAFSCYDAAMAYLSHGPNMQSVSVILFICAALETVVWFLLLSTLIFRRKIILHE